MCFDGSDCITRRSFLAGAAAAAAVATLRPNVFGQKNLEPRALDDPKLIKTEVMFPSGAISMKGYLARPKKSGHYPALLIIHGDPGLPEWVRNTAARLAQAGYAAMVMDIASHPDRVQRPIEYYRGRAFDDQVSADALAAIDYLKHQPFIKRGGMGIVGFCYGGRKALLLPIQSKDLKAGVSFYGPARDRAFRSASDPRPDVVDLANRITFPVQGHYGELDKVAVAADARELEQKLKEEKTPSEFYYYQGAGHGFYGNPWEQQSPEFGYNGEAAKLAHKRMLKFLKRHLS